MAARRHSTAWYGSHRGCGGYAGVGGGKGKGCKALQGAELFAHMTSFPSPYVPYLGFLQVACGKRCGGVVPGQVRVAISYHVVRECMRPCNESPAQHCVRVIPARTLRCDTVRYCTGRTAFESLAIYRSATHISQHMTHGIREVDRRDSLERFYLRSPARACHTVRAIALLSAMAMAVAIAIE